MWRLRKQSVGMMAMALAIVAVACNDSSPPDELTAQKNWLVKTWNSPEGEALVLKGVSPWDALDDSLSDAERDEVVSNATEELLQGCYATRLSLRLPVVGGTTTYHFQRGTKSDNPTCETLVSVEEQHESSLVGVYRCDLRELKLDRSAQDTSALLSYCEGVADPLQRLPMESSCAVGLNSWFVCEVGTTCEAYPLDDGKVSSLGVCTSATGDEALAYAVFGPRAFMIWTQGAGDWAYALYASLDGPTGDAAAWTSFWKAVLVGTPPLYVTWSDEEGNSVTIFKGWSESPPSPYTALTDTLVALAPNDGEPEVMRCADLPSTGASWDADGQLQDIPAYIAQVKESCASAQDVYPLASDVVCPADDASPFHCQNATDVCESSIGSWLGVCTSTQD